MFGFKVVTQYEQGIVFRFGRALPVFRKTTPFSTFAWSFGKESVEETCDFSSGRIKRPSVN